MNITAFDDYIDRLLLAEGIGIENLPLNILDIAQNIFGIKVRERNGLNEKLESIIGFRNNECFLYYNSKFPTDKLNVITAHELVHYINDDKTESQQHYKKKMRHNSCSIEIRADRFRKIILMPRYLVKKMKNLHFSKEQIIDKFGLKNYKDIAEQRFSELGLFKEESKALKQSKINNIPQKNINNANLTYYGSILSSNFSLNEDSILGYIQVPNILAKDAEFTVGLTGIKLEDRILKENSFGFVKKCSEFNENDLVLVKSGYKYSVIEYKIFNEVDFEIIGKVIDHFQIPSPVIQPKISEEKQLSLF